MTLCSSIGRFVEGALCDTKVCVLDRCLCREALNDSTLKEHYSSLVQACSNNESALRWLQHSGTDVFFNNNCRLGDHSIKYGVLSTECFLRDLLTWTPFCAAPRLHKPVILVTETEEHTAESEFFLPPADFATTLSNEPAELLHMCNPQTHSMDQLQTLMSLNRLMAACVVRARNQPIPSTVEMDEFLHQIVALSYDGDLRTTVGLEMTDKTRNIVNGQYAHLERIYRHLLPFLGGVVDGSTITFENAHSDLSMGFTEEARRRADTIRVRNREVSLRMALKGLLTTDPLTYAMQKLRRRLGK
ncbi:MAG: hypothetical protein MHM6MM_001429 [Cercozoa sp. M6MM]